MPRPHPLKPSSEAPFFSPAHLAGRWKERNSGALSTCHVVFFCAHETPFHSCGDQASRRGSGWPPAIGYTQHSSSTLLLFIIMHLLESRAALDHSISAGVSVIKYDSQVVNSSGAEPCVVSGCAVSCTGEAGQCELTHSADAGTAPCLGLMFPEAPQERGSSSPTPPELPGTVPSLESAPF